MIMRTRLGPILVALVSAAKLIARMAWSATETDLPPVQTQGEVTYLSGGIGGDQQAAMRRAAALFPLELQFVETRDAQSVYTAGVEIRIRDRTGKFFLEARSDGKVMLARLPQGQYTITADNSGRVETREVTVETGKHKAVMFQWSA